MPMPSNIPAGFTHGSSFEYAADINLGTAASPVWQEIRLTTNLAVTRPKATRPQQTFEDAGAPNQGVTGVGHVIAITMDTPRDEVTGARLPEYTKLRTAASSPDPGNTVHIRWYDKPRTAGLAPDPDDAWEGYASVDETWTNTDATGQVRASAFTLTGQGRATKIANPAVAVGTAQAPVISSITPAGQSVGDQVEIVGSNFVGVTTITIDGVSVPAGTYTVQNASTIIATIPTGAVGASPVIVTTAAGASAAVSYTVV